MSLRTLTPFLLLFLLLKTVPAKAQTTTALPDAMVKKIDGLFSKWNNSTDPGCVIGIVRNDSLIYTKGYGLANLEYGIANTPETIYHMASVSKQFTAYAIVLLAEQGKLQLDDDIRKYLSWFPDLKEKITIRHLLNHTSGIRDQWQLLAISGTRIDDVITQEHIVKVLGKQRALNFKPGERFSYSNSGFTMLAEIVRSVSGKTLRQFTDSAIFKPLGMAHTNFHDDYTEVVKNRAYSYYPNEKGFSYSTLSYSNAGATSLFTNMNDLAKWVMNFYRTKAGTAKDIETLVQKNRLNNGQLQDYALGIVNNQFKGWKQYSHNGADAGYRTSLNIFPDKKMGFILFSNRGDFDMGKMGELIGLFVQDTARATTQPAASIDSTATVLTDLTRVMPIQGNYFSDDGTKNQFRLMGKRLYWEGYGMKEVLKKTSQDTFQVAGRPDLKFLFRQTANRDTLVQECWPGGREFRKYAAMPKLNNEQLKAYAGTYYCPELDCKFGIALKGQELVLSNNKYSDMKIRLDTKDHLSTDFWWMAHLKIRRDQKGKINGFEVNDGRIMHLDFQKTE